jgi:hypothetical protein
VVELDRVGSVGYLFSFLSMVILHILTIPGSRFSGSVEEEKSGDGTNSNTWTGPRKLQCHKRFLNIDTRPMASFVFLTSFHAHCGSLSNPELPYKYVCFISITILRLLFLMGSII